MIYASVYIYLQLNGNFRVGTGEMELPELTEANLKAAAYEVSRMANADGVIFLGIVPESPGIYEVMVEKGDQIGTALGEIGKKRPVRQVDVQAVIDKYQLPGRDFLQKIER